MKESDLYRPVKAWLEAQGFRVVPEVPVLYSAIDVVGVREDAVVGIEMKLCLSEKVIRQGWNLQMACDRGYLAVASKPRSVSIEQAKKLGLGVLRVKKGSVEVLLEPNQKEPPVANYRERVLSKCAHMSTQGRGGVPCLDGVGPARDCKRRVGQYLKRHPKASWAELYEKVPNHYASAKSMSGALGFSMRQRDYWKKLRREERKA